MEIHFNKERGLSQELTLKADTSISLIIIETLTGKKETTTPVKVHLRAVFTKYAITPARGLNFGPLVYNTTSNPRVVEIANTGEFPFRVAIAAYGDEEAFKPQEPPEQPAAGGAPAKGACQTGSVCADRVVWLSWEDVGLIRRSPGSSAGVGSYFLGHVICQ